MGTAGLIIDLLLLFLACLISFALYPLWINFVYKFQMGESVRSDGPLSHLKKEGTPTMGGLVFVFTVTIVCLVFNRSRTQTLFPLFVAALAGLLGMLEDFTKVYRRSGLPGFFEYHFGKFFKKSSSGGLKFGILSKAWNGFKELSFVVGSSEEGGIKTYHKFIFQGLIAGFVSYWAYFKLGWDYISFPLLGNVHIGLGYPIFVFFLFIIILNAVAFTDGLDGLAGSLSMVCLVSFWLLSRVLAYNSLAGFCATFIGAMIPFLYFNIFPARVFMGNVGSYVLGATMAILAVVMHKELAFLIMGLVFLVDGVSSPLQQIVYKLTKKRVFRMAPLHHHFELLGWHESKITLRFLLFGILFAFAGIFVAIL
jgi:phospho-N-acetylmuramoyl-pentapeptide-transferase